jgi:hypothetical protein
MNSTSPVFFLSPVVREPVYFKTGFFMLLRFHQFVIKIEYAGLKVGLPKQQTGILFMSVTLN